MPGACLEGTTPTTAHITSFTPASPRTAHLPSWHTRTTRAGPPPLIPHWTNPHAREGPVPRQCSWPNTGPRRFRLAPAPGAPVRRGAPKPSGGASRPRARAGGRSTRCRAAEGSLALERGSWGSWAGLPGPEEWPPSEATTISAPQLIRSPGKSRFA